MSGQRMTLPHPTHESYLATRHFGSLDGLRFICITMVIWHHAGIWPELDKIFFARGHTGVDFFFVLSGYLITTLLLREEDRTGQISLRGFYWRRVLRIVPIYFFVVTLAAFYEIGVKGQTENLDILPYYYLFLSNFIEGRDIVFLDPTWSLSVEEQYYLIWPALLILCPRRWLWALLSVMIAWNVAVALDVFDRIGITAINVGPLSFGIRGPTYAPILMGSLVAVLLHNARGFQALCTLTGFRAAPWVWFLVLGVTLAAMPDTLRGWPNVAVHSAMCLVLVSLVIREDNAMAHLMQQPLITRIGQISYGIYLYHLFALVIVMKAFEVFGRDPLSLLDWWLIFGLYYALSVVISEISFRTLEAFFMGFRKRGWGRA